MWFTPVVMVKMDNIFIGQIVKVEKNVNLFLNIQSPQCMILLKKPCLWLNIQSF